MKEIATLHYITQEVKGKTHCDLITLACESGIRWVQLRIKNRPKEEILEVASEAQKICLGFGAILIINDHVDIAKKTGADGVHLGMEDMSPPDARKILGPEAIIGGTCNTIEDVRRVIGEGVNYAGIGPFRFTATKTKLNPILGLEGINRILRESGDTIPLIAIGGIKVEDVPSLLKIGVHGVAVASSINLSYDIRFASKAFLSNIKKYEKTDHSR